MMSAIARTAESHGDVVEVGVLRGATSIFLERFMANLGLANNYWAIDTFGGFDSSDIDDEVSRRRKDRFQLDNVFRYNDAAVFEANVQHAGASRVKVLLGDIKTVRLPDGLRIAAALIDVDLYRPTLVALERLFPLLIPGGVIVLDDIAQGSQYDGASEAFHEFVSRTDCEFQIIPPKTGVIRPRGSTS